MGFFNNRCQCIANAIYNEDNGSCECQDGYVQNVDTCEAGEGTIICPADQVLNEEGTGCTCQENYKQNNDGSCVRCYGVSAFINQETNECDCGQFALFDPQDYGKCICNPDIPEIYAFFGTDSSSCIECRRADFNKYIPETGECKDISADFENQS